MKYILSICLLFISQFANSQSLNKPYPDPAMLQSFAPTGVLRVGINLGNPVLAGIDPVSQKLKGVSIDIANEIGKRSGLPVQLIPFQSAGATVDAIKSGSIDLVFVAIDPVRGEGISYTPAYIQIEGAYLVKTSSPIKNNDEVDVVGNEIIVGKGSAYDLFLTREIKNATLLRAPNSQSVVGDFMKGQGNVAAGVKQQLESDAVRYSGSRILPGRFMVINQAIGIPKSRSEYEKINTYLSAIIADLKTSGFVTNAMKRHDIQGAKVAD
ncbi:ABC transporter substrate-binding protein [Polynucleobacter sp. Latsch14-2]|jgi:polar amino acid transport system substrate-binding protein|uniref:ABC transporter substrate-binding protein n=1 Tax=Polynucleobacter sp. Latsch14-2 TaxID=2576920 RepID=UPI001C0D4221|nr:ABC transporter substrate-binding protein [Polynucleobacter sp. Latsch14-2]MBU3615161.1 ABC transporter substrate-binding protein [Polynucleobacter sp. Latsch14-2]